jgi:hypothetical protein
MFRLDIEKQPVVPTTYVYFDFYCTPPPGKGRDGTVGSDRSGVGSAWFPDSPGYFGQASAAAFSNYIACKNSNML